MAGKASTEAHSGYIDTAPTYHTDKQAHYVLPNGSPEHLRLETQARHLQAIMNGRVIHAPLAKTEIRSILDVGCGTGVVTNYLAQQYPDAEVVGVDLSPVPALRDRPSNVRFLQGNILTEKPSSWRPSEDSNGQANILSDAAAFDLIYSRLLLCGMSDWPQYLRTCFQLLRPGGWTEIHDLDWIWYDRDGNDISATWDWLTRLRAAAEKRGLYFRCGSRTQRWMEEAGFQDVQVRTYRWPFGGQWENEECWRDFGQYVASAMVEMFWHLIPRLMMGRPECTAEMVEGMQRDMQRDFAPVEGKHWVFYVSCGRKPEV
ncbi:hypothetical protein B0A50_06125 [Salinomyces thailandicus]|uniref:S-adenosyl-L-methionine-dependent methyltransferase n=1 Tax=Salinomyces thailandicus TaxID=706561 RepID=A0A4U0TS76_9PEZI|nr:hypothetical protein B0A50_06125 [Salinomyces thailandica]